VISNFEFIENSPKLQDGKLLIAFPSIYMFDEFYSHGKVMAEIIASSHNMRPFVRVWGSDICPEYLFNTQHQIKLTILKLTNTELLLFQNLS